MNHSIADIQERDFVLGIRRALDESADHLPQATLAQLAQARQAALQRKKPHANLHTVPIAAFADAARHINTPQPTSRKVLIGSFLVLLITALTSMAYWQHQQHSVETVDIDAAMLSSDLPLNAYLDHGFNAYLSRAPHTP